MTFVLSIVALVALVFAVSVHFNAKKQKAKLLQLKQAEFIRTYKWPAGLFDKLAKIHPSFKRKESALVSRGLRQFFVAYLMSGNKYVSMPSQAADDLWHEFILFTRDYDSFCKDAFGGFLHHTPAVVLAEGQKSSNEGLRRVWWYACKYDNLDPRNPTRLPLLFALDAKLNIRGGYKYHPNCQALRDKGVAGAQCGGDFSSSSYDGSTSGFGDSGSVSSDSSSGDSSSSDSSGSDGGGGGCGGGGD